MSRFINYTRFFFCALLLFWLVILFLHTDSSITQDLGRHLALGKIIWEDGHVPAVNLFSYTYSDFPFVNHHWGSEVIFYGIERMFSPGGLIIGKTIVVLTSVFLLFWFSIKRTHPVAFLLSGFLTLHLLWERTEIRPEIFGYLFCSLFLLILYREREKEGRLVWLLPLISLLWANTHISFIFSWCLFLLFLFECMIVKKWRKRYGVIALLIFCASVTTPFGVKGAFYPLVILKQYGYTIVENQSPFFLETVMNDPAIFYFKVTLCLFLVVSPLIFIRKKYFLLTSVFLFATISLFAIRHFPFFALSSFFPLAFGCSFLLSKIPRSIRIGISILLVGMIGVTIVELISNTYYFNRYSAVRTGIGQVKGMKNGVDFFIKEHLPGPIFNNFDIGSYLAYRLYPAEKVFVDGRPEAYPVTFFTDTYIPMQENEEVWKKKESEYGFRTIIFSHTDATNWGRQFLWRIVRDREWKLVFFDDYGMILTKKEQGQEESDTLSAVRKQGLREIQKAHESDEVGRLIHFFDSIGLNDVRDIGKIKAAHLVSKF